SRTSAYSASRAALSSVITACSPAGSVNAIGSTRAVPPPCRTRPARRRTSRATSAVAGSRQTDCCRYSAPSDRSLRHTCTRRLAAAPAVDTLTTSQVIVVVSSVTSICYVRNEQSGYGPAASARMWTVVPADDPVRGTRLRRGFALEYVTLGWNVAGIVILAIAAAAARSVALAGFGLDSLIEIGAS